MDTDPNQVAYLVFDVEAVADGRLVGSVRYPKENLTPKEAIARYRAELMEEFGSDVMAPTFMQPCAVAVAKVDSSYRLLDVAALDEPEYRPYHIAKKFWLGWRHYRRPVLVTFNGRGYDLPVMELAAFRYGLSLPEWFNVYAKSFEQSRNRYNSEAHIDLMDLVSNFSAFRVTGGLNLLANVIGKPGKTGIDGSKIQDIYNDGLLGDINDYCRCDVLDTYFVFLRTRVLIGRLTLDEEQVIVGETKQWIEQQAETNKAYRHYLENWGKWEKPAE
jgi:predicted PolB exonuclease-like 3'-5' exonuclease